MAISPAERATLAEKAEERRRTAASHVTEAIPTLYQPHDKGLDERLKLRKQINKILECHGLSKLRMLLKMATNILDNPDEDTFRRFKINNKVIKERIMRPSGVFEFVIEMGFSSEKVIEFEPCRIWVTHKKKRLELCKQLLDEAITQAPITIARRDEGLAQARKREEDAEAVELEKKRFLDDRKKVKMREEREKQRRDQGTEDTPDTTQKLSSSMKVITLQDLAPDSSTGVANGEGIETNASA